MVEALIEKFSKEGYHLLIEGTLRTVATPLSTARLLKSQGYSVILSVMATKPIFSYLGTLARYEAALIKYPQTARAASKAHHDEIVEVIVQNVQELEDSGVFDIIEIFDRDRGLLTIFPPEEDPADYLKGLLFSPLLDREIKKLEDELIDFQKDSEMNGHLDENRKVIDDLRQILSDQ